MKILIPMAGNGQRFVDAGYWPPKPLIDVLGKTMIERVIENLGGPSEDFVFIVRGEHVGKYNIIEYLRRLCPGCHIEVAWEPTMGAACTALLASTEIDTTESLLIANADQLVEWSGQKYIPPSPTFVPDGAIYTFEADHPKWSYAAVDEHGWVHGVAEKQVISNRATCGIYWFRRGSDFVRFARQMIEKNLRVNNEFYIAPVYNQMLREGRDVVELPVKRMWGLGTPEDLHAYEDAHRT